MSGPAFRIQAADPAPSCAASEATPEVHIAGVLVQAHPRHADDIALALALLPGAEVTHRAPDGRIVAVLEAPTSRAVMQQIEAARELKGVLNISLVYQHAESLEDMSKEQPA